MANAQVILKEKIEGLGAEADVVKVRAGYARNFLIPQGKAYEANRSNLRHVEALKTSRARREAEELARLPGNRHQDLQTQAEVHALHRPRRQGLRFGDQHGHPQGTRSRRHRASTATRSNSRSR